MIVISICFQCFFPVICSCESMRRLQQRISVKSRGLLLRDREYSCEKLRNESISSRGSSSVQENFQTQPRERMALSSIPSISSRSTWKFPSIQFFNKTTPQSRCLQSPLFVKEFRLRHKFRKKIAETLRTRKGNISLGNSLVSFSSVTRVETESGALD